MKKLKKVLIILVVILAVVGIFFFLFGEQLGSLGSEGGWNFEFINPGSMIGGLDPGGLIGGKIDANIFDDIRLNPFSEQ
jgi:hypothetical protein